MGGSLPTTLGGLGSVGASFYDTDQPVTKTDQWNLTVEREILPNTVLRVAYLGNHGSDLDQLYDSNETIPNYVWFTETGLPLPQGADSGVARRVYTGLPYGNIEKQMKTGWSNFNGVQVELNRRFSNGIGFQFFYLMSNSFRAGGNDWRDDIMQDTRMFPTGSVPENFDQRNRLLNYHLDSEIPKHHIRWNWLVDLPFGRGKKIGGNAGGIMNRLIGGWQVAGMGQVRSRWWQMPTSDFGFLNNIEFYGTKYPIEDCRSGQCQKGYLYFNGYIPANRINSHDANGKPNGVMGVPANYKPAFGPKWAMPADGGNSNDPNYQYIGSDTVFVPLKNGTLQPVEFDNGLHPWRNQWRLGPMLWSMDASVFKVIPITERVKLRFNADFFNVLNMPGMPMPNASSGLISMQNSVNDPRELQLTLRLFW